MLSIVSAIIIGPQCNLRMTEAFQFAEIAHQKTDTGRNFGCCRFFSRVICHTLMLWTSLSPSSKYPLHSSLTQFKCLSGLNLSSQASHLFPLFPEAGLRLPLKVLITLASACTFIPASTNLNLFVPPAKECPPLSQPDTGHRSCLRGKLTSNSTCGLKCYLGFLITGRQDFTCNVTGDWSGPRPHCASNAVKSCDPLSRFCCFSALWWVIISWAVGAKVQVISIEMKLLHDSGYDQHFFSCQSMNRVCLLLLCVQPFQSSPASVFAAYGAEKVSISQSQSQKNWDARSCNRP